MSVRNWIIGVVAVCVGSPFAVGALGMLGIGGGFYEEVPEWRAGYEWLYDSVFDVSFSASAFGAHEGGSVQVQGESKRVVANTTIDLDDVPLYAVAEQYRPLRVVVDGDVEFDAAEAGAENESGYEWVGCAIMCVGDYGFYTREHLNPYFPGGDDWATEEIHFLDFPLKRKSWTVSSWEEDWVESEMDMEGEGVSWVVKAEAIGKGYVRLPGVGAMEAVQVRAALTPESQEAFRKSLQAEFADEVEGLSMRVDAGYELEYWFAPEARQIVRMDSLMFVEARVTYQGDVMQMREEMRVTETLKKYSLVEGPERSLEDVMRINRLLDDLPEIRELSEVKWPFAVGASTLSVDATRGGTVDLGVVAGAAGGDLVAKEFDSVPDGMSVEWRHRYLKPVFEEADGERYPSHVQPKVERYKGETLELPILEQGLHEVTAYLLDAEGALVGAESIILEGRGVWEYESGLPVGLPAVGGRHLLPFETSMFLKQVDFTVDPAAFGQGSAQWEGPEGAGSFGVSGHTESSAPSTIPEMWGPWTLLYDDLARLGDLSIQIEAHYDRSIDPAPYLRNAQPAASQSAEATPAWFDVTRFTERCPVPGGACGFARSGDAVVHAFDRLDVAVFG